MSAPRWERFLEPGERILWQGRPAAPVKRACRDYMAILFGFFVILVGGLMIALDASKGGLSGSGAGLRLATLLVVPVLGGMIVLWGAFWTILSHESSHYLLTDRKAVISRRVAPLPRYHNAWPIGPGSPIWREEKENGLGSVYFHIVTKANEHGQQRRPVGFLMIEDSEKVLAILENLKGEGT